MKTIAIVTSGGDAPGMNAAIRAITRIATSQKAQVIGFERGWEGLIKEQLHPAYSKICWRHNSVRRNDSSYIKVPRI